MNVVERSAERYPFKNRPSSSHNQLVTAAGPGRGKLMIDVGCARGLLGQEMQATGWRVLGVEVDDADAKLAAAILTRVHHGTLDTLLGTIGEPVEAIVFADVLEHLVDPVAALTTAHTLLERGGRLLVSIPNVAHASMRWSLMRGRFDYTDRGILDRTHVRFYTKRTAVALVQEAGFTIERIWGAPAPIELVWPRLASSALGRTLLQVNDGLPRLWPNMFAYQILISATRT